MEATVYRNQPPQTTITKISPNNSNEAYVPQPAKQDTSAPPRFNNTNQGRDPSPQPDNRDKSAPAYEKSL